MKIERIKKQFEPVVITLESEDELLYLWHLLSLYKTDVEDLCSDNPRPFPTKIDDQKMFDLIEKILEND